MNAIIVNTCEWFPAKFNPRNLGADHSTSEGGGGGGVIWSGREIFFQHLNSQWNFFFRVSACKLFFSPSNILQEFFFVWMGLKK